MNEQSSASKNNAQQRMTLQWSRVIGICALFTSVCALMVSVWQARQSIRHQKISVLPYLQCYTSNLHGLSYFISNEGLGPAIIQKVRVVHEGKAYRDVFQPMFAYLDSLPRNPKDSMTYWMSNLNPGMLLKSGETRELFHFEARNNQPLKEAIMNRFQDQLFIQINYSDLYGACWQFDNQGSPLKRVDDCPEKILDDL
jgi:hypothetical protein